MFQLPILIYFLSRVGLVTPSFLKKYRRHSIILIVTLSAIITPPDVFSQVLVALPLMVLYEIGISISKRIMRQQEEAMTANDRPKKSKKKGEPTAKENSTSEEVSTKKKKPTDDSEDVESD